jgi:hypothetical protein
MSRDINHTDDSTEAVEQFRAFATYREHPPIPKMTGPYSYESVAKSLFTNHTKEAKR